MALVNARRTTKLIEGGHHRGFQAYRPTGWAKLSDTTLHFCL